MNILVPTDLSLKARWAFELALDIASRTDAKVTLLHVIEQPTEQSFNVEGEVALIEDWEERLYVMKLIAKATSELNILMERAGAVTVEKHLRLGNAFHGISNIITEHSVDLIVMGTANHSRAERMLGASITEKVIHRATCPVLTVHEQAGGIRFENIVYASSLHDNERAFARVLKSVQDIYGSTIHLLRVNTRSHFMTDAEAHEAMRTFAEKLQLRNTTVNVISDTSEESGIMNFSKAINADLIGMATHHRHGIIHSLEGSTTEEVVNLATLPVLTYVTN